MESSGDERNAWLSADDSVLSAQCELDFHKASGHGGQHVNKTSSAVRVRHLPSGLDACSAESRSQHENRKYALDLLRQKIALSIRCPADSGFQIGNPPVSLKNPLYPLWMAQLLDVFTDCNYQLKPAAEKLGTGTSRLVKLLYRDRTLWQKVQKMRADAGLPLISSPE